MEQLKMFFDHSRCQLPEFQVPSGYTLRTFTRKDTAQYLNLRPLAGFSPWTTQDLDNYLESQVRVIMLAVENHSGYIAAAASAEKSENPLIGCLGWVMCDPAHRGHGLGRLVIHAATKTLTDFGYRQSFLLTDDWRLPALHIYLSLGWQPECKREGMLQRWLAVGEQLKMKIIPSQLG